MCIVYVKTRELVENVGSGKCRKKLKKENIEEENTEIKKAEKENIDKKNVEEENVEMINISLVIYSSMKICRISIINSFVLLSLFLH